MALQFKFLSLQQTKPINEKISLLPSIGCHGLRPQPPVVGQALPAHGGQTLWQKLFFRDPYGEKFTT